MSQETGGSPVAFAIRLLPEISARGGGGDEPVLMRAGLCITDCSDAKHKRHSARFTEKEERKQPCHRRPLSQPSDDDDHDHDEGPMYRDHPHLPRREEASSRMFTYSDTTYPSHLHQPAQTPMLFPPGVLEGRDQCRPTTNARPVRCAQGEGSRGWR